MKTRIFTLVVLAFLVAGTASAQNGANRAMMPMQTPDQIATQQAGKMKEALGLSDKQVKEITKIYKAEATAREQALTEIYGITRPAGNQGQRPGGPQGGFQGAPQGAPQGAQQGGQRPPQGQMNPAMGRMQQMNPEEQAKLREKYEIAIAKAVSDKEKALKKVLSDGQYKSWRLTNPISADDIGTNGQQRR